MKSAAGSDDEDRRLREAAEIRAELKRISGEKHGGLEGDQPMRRALAAGFGALALLIGAGLLMKRDRNKA